MDRRALIGMAAALGLPGIAQAQAWPSARPIRLIVPYIPGSAPDVIARQLAERLTQALGQAVPIENRGGAGGNIGTEYAARQAPDGYALMIGTNAILVNPVLYARPVGYDPLRDFAPVTVATAMPHALIVPPSGPATIGALIESLKARPGQNYASGGNGSGAHLAAELFKARAGVQATHVPFRGAPDIVNNVMAANVEFGFPTLATATELVRAGRLRALAVTSPSRNHALPDVPAVAETLPGFDLVSWFAVMAPAGTPPEIVARLDAAIQQALADPALRARIMADGSIVMAFGPERFAAFIRTEAAKWGEAVRISGARVD